MNHKSLMAVMLVLAMLLPVLIVLPDNVAAETGTTVGTTTDSTPIYNSFQSRGPYYVDGRYWVFWYDGTNTVYSSSNDLTTWVTKATLVSVGIASFAITCDGTYFHIGYVELGTLKYVRGDPNSNGVMTLGTVRIIVDGSVNACSAPSICISTDDHVFISYRQSISGSTYPFVIKNDDTTSSDTWNTAANFPLQLSSVSVSTWSTKVLPSSSGGVFCLYVKSASSPYLKTCSSTGTLGGEESCGLGNTAGVATFGATSYSGVLYFVYVKVTSNNLVYRQRASDGTWDATETVIQTSTILNLVPSITYDVSSGSITVFWMNYPTTNHVYYRQLNDGIWDDVVDWMDETLDTGLNVAQHAAPNILQNNKLLLVYKTKASSPYNIKIASHDLVSPPVAAFSADKTTAEVGESITFTDSSTNSPTNLTWSFGDGATGYGASVSHSYSTAGTYTVTLNASNSAGYDLETKTGYINVGEIPVANFTADVLEGYTPLEVVFTDHSTGTTPLTWSWSFGDGSISLEQSPTHVYEDAGSFNVTLTVTNAYGSDSLTRAYYINITLTLAITSSPDLTMDVGTVYEYNIVANYVGTNFTVWTNSGEIVLGPNGSYVSGRITSLGNVRVVITAIGLDGQVAYQNYTLTVQEAEGTLTDQSTMAIIMYVVGFVLTIIVALIGMNKSRPIIVIIAAVFGVLVLGALMNDVDAQAYWFLGFVPMVEFLMAFVSMR